MVNIQPGASEEQHFILTSLSPSPVQKRMAIAVALALVIAFVITAGLLSSIQLPEIVAFVPAYAAAMFVNDSITALLLFAQFTILNSRALLVVATGYVFTALILIPWMLTFPGVFSREGLLGAGPQSTAWLYILWHAGFPVFVTAYALLKDRDSPKTLWKAPRRAAVLSTIAVFAGVSAATFLTTATDAFLPRLLIDTVHLSLDWQYAAVSVALLIVGALAVLWRRQRTLLDLWLLVVLLAYAIEIFLISFPVPARYSVGWYAGRVFGLLSSSLVLFVLLYEISTLYGRLLYAVLAQRREREARLVIGDAVAGMIAHEVKQPLSGMVTNAYAGLRLLKRSVPDLDETNSALEQIVADGHRAGEVIESVRTLFKADAQKRNSLNLSALITEALSFLRADVHTHAVTIQAEPNAQIPAVIGDPILLRQVLVNLMTNAIESMAVTIGPRILSVRSEVRDSCVLISVSDTGEGLKLDDREKVFNPLFTTKPNGMGMGLSICRSIVEAHGGRLWAVPNTPQGVIFQFVLPADVGISGAAK